MKILLIYGGWSPERDVSINGAKIIKKALCALGHEVTDFDLMRDFDNLLHEAVKHDFAFISLHGAPGEDGLVQALLERVGIPYQGSNPAGSFLALNKACAKQIFRFNGLPTPDWELVVKPVDNWKPSFPFPLFIKSNTGGSSLRLSRVENVDQLTSAMTEIFSAGEEVLIESEVKGTEITCGVLGDTPLPPVLIEPIAGVFFDYDSKYKKGAAKETCPAPIDQKLTEEIQKMALAAHKALGLANYSRTDFILQENGDLTILEVNTLPGMTDTSLVPQEAASVGISFPQLLERLIELGRKEKK